jgi:putative Mn2+ efflux pump MntP
VKGSKIMLLGIAIILLAIACSTSLVGWAIDGIPRFVSQYGHWLGIIITLVGLLVPEDSNA